ncbi:transcription initiation factor IIF subunit beta [Trichophyton equinum CBS 127.97]|uniref:Transcription initiation factor IIF subunit beta n=1 Tax=Trichophyton equinum (strain ATCC MYA-4606 / CBS 127.97) TaxID=559882 RepID=F2PXN2_TRIEC|nr:transcription initiation factor IIF subunit beta [Trichophyton equinum CBS 127.97]
MNMANLNAGQVKAEPPANPGIKEEPDTKDTNMSDEDIYEDTGDLDFTNAFQNVWLTRIPRTLWEQWSKLDDDEEIQIGTVRVEGDPTDIKRISLRLLDIPQNKGVPKDYNLRRQNVNADRSAYAVQNTFVFTEKDLPGYKDKMSRFYNENQPYGRSYLYEQTKRDAKKKERKKKWEPYVRKTVPRQTAITARVHDEFNCLPVENEEYQRLAEERALESLKPKRETKFIEKVPGKMLQPKTVAAADKSNFIQIAKPAKVRAQENKTARMPQNELLDLIYACFRRHKYWPFKALKAELQQPEVYLKQTLEIVAHLVKSGDFAMTWELKPEARESNYADAIAYRDAKEELPPTAGYSFDEGSEGEPTASGRGTDADEDDNVKFENV